MNYRDFLEQGRYEEAVNELQIELELDSDDDKRSLLALCWFMLGKSKDAFRAIQQIEHPTHRDYELLANIYWQFKNWDEMSIALRSALRINPSAYTYYRLAVAEGKGRYSFDIDAASKEIMQSYLLKATDFEDCPVEAYLFLVELYNHDELENKVNTLNKAFEKYPDNATVRLELAPTLIYRKGQYERAITLLSPLLGTEKFDQRARWYTFEASVRQKSYRDAIQYLDGILIQEDNFISRIKADLLFRQGKLGEWLTYFAEHIDNKSPESIIQQHFRKAYVNLQKNNLKQAINDFNSGANLLLGIDINIDSWIKGLTADDVFIYKECDVITDVCEILVLLKDETELLSQYIIGLLIYTIQKHFSEEHQEELLQFFPEILGSPLLFAAELLNYPAILGYEVAQEIVDKDLPQATSQYLNYAIWKFDSDDYFLEELSEQLYKEEDRLNKEILPTISSINEIALAKLRECESSKTIIKVFLPFYTTIWRNILFKTNSFNIVAEINQKFIDASNGATGLFDYAYSVNYLGNRDEAEATYVRLINQEPRNTAAHNNLGVIYEQKGMFDEAFELFYHAARLEPSNNLYSSNSNRLEVRLDFRNKSLQKFQDALKKIKDKAFSVGFNNEQLEELNKLYWESDTPIKAIQERLALKRYGSSNINSFVIPIFTGERCPNCLMGLVYKNRSAKKTEEKICLGCTHKNRGWCNCEYCIKIQEERRQQSERARRQAAIEEFNHLKEQYCEQAYVEWAVTKLSRREKIFLRAFIEVIQSSEKPTWEEICERAGVVSHKLYVEKLRKLKLLLVDPDGRFLVNSIVKLSMIEVENVRKISPSIRFDVFQRDNHTCQYCGRTPPEVKLVIDHLIPVAQGGTDAFENLVTSCEECNSGKSDKLIKDFTGGYNKGEWAEQIRSKRSNLLKERREKLDEIKQHWTNSLRRRSLSERDNTAIHTFIERYEPDWIKAAIDIAVRKGIQDYIKYTGGILRNWAKDSPPEYLSNPDAGLVKKPATPKQIAYIASLLERSRLSLNDVSDKTDFDQLTMSDARNLIAALTEEVDE